MLISTTQGRHKMTNQERVIRKQLDDLAVNWYLEFVNDYLTYEKFAEHKGISVKAAKVVIEDGKKINEERANA
jgi:hypothetical protein